MIVVVVVVVVLVILVVLTPLLGMLLMALFRAHMLIVTDLVPHGFVALAFPLPDVFRVVFA
jgi:hypothetical protein